MTALEWTFTVEGLPVPKARPRVTRGGHVFTPATTVDFERRVREAALAAGVPRFARGVFVQITAFVPDLRARDWDNLGKAVCDALNPIRRKRQLVEPGVAWHDDSQVTHATVIKRLDRECPRTEVTISPDPAGVDFAPRAARQKAPLPVFRPHSRQEKTKCLEPPAIGRSRDGAPANEIPRSRFTITRSP